MTAFDRQQGSFRLTTDTTSMDLDAIHAYLSRSYWSEGIPKELVARAMAGSICFGLLENVRGSGSSDPLTPSDPLARQRQIGFARVITDRATYAYLCDVYVLEEYQGRGLGTWLLRELVTHPDLQGLRRFALVTRDAHGLYEKFGFERLADPSGHMQIARPGLYLATSYQPPASQRRTGGDWLRPMRRGAGANARSGNVR